MQEDHKDKPNCDNKQNCAQACRYVTGMNFARLRGTLSGFVIASAEESQVDSRNKSIMPRLIMATGM